MSDVQPIPGRTPDADAARRKNLPAKSPRLHHADEDDVLYDELDAPSDRFIKVYTTDNDPDGLPLDALDQAAVQVRMAKAKAKHWAFVREAAKEPNGYRLVVPVHTSSVQRLISERHRLRAAQLYAVVAGVVAGLGEIRQELKRTHGNLKPTNVLLRSRRVSDPDVVALTDPATTTRADAQGEAADLRRLGEMIHLLVLHRLPRGHDDWPVPPSHEWRQLGRRGEAWRDLCTLLTEPPAPRMTLEEVTRHVARLRPTPRAVVYGGAAVLSAAVAATIWGVAHSRPSHRTEVATKPPPPPHPTLAMAPATQPAKVAPQSPASQPALAMVPPRPQVHDLPPPPTTSAAPVVTSPAPPPKPALDPQIAHQLMTELASTWASRAKLASAAIAAETARVKQDLDHTRRQQTLARFLDECARPAVAALPQVAKAIDDQNHRFAATVSTDASRFTPDLVKQRDQVIRRLALVDRAMKTVAAPTPLPKATTPIGQQVSTAVAQDAQPSQAATVTAGVNLALSPGSSDEAFTGALQALVKDATSSRAGAVQLAAEVEHVTQRLSEGFTPNTAPDGIKLRDLAERWPQAPAYKLAGVKSALAPLLEAMNATDPAALRRVVDAKDQLLGLRIAAWWAMPLPTGRRADLEADLKTRDALLAAAAGTLKNSAHFDPVAAGIAGEYAHRWERALAQFTKGADVAYALADAARPASLDLTKLPPAALWNVRWYELRTTLAARGTADTLPRARLIVADLLRAAQALSPDRQKQVAAVVAKLQGWDGKPTGEDFAQLGPASPAARAVAGPSLRWTVLPDGTGTTVTYRPSSTTDATLLQDDALVFRRVSSPTGDVFVCTTETSFDVFSDVITAANRWREVKDKQLLGAAPDVVTPPDLRPGPRVWQWSPRRDAGIVRTLVWLSSDWVPAGADDYPESLGGEFNRATLRPPHGHDAENANPSRHHPMQQISSDAAQYFAALVGCRLPSPQEWRLAYASTGQTLAGANLRDKSWRLEQEHVARTWLRGGTTYRADAGMFTPAGEAPTDSTWTTGAGQEYDDGYLWFREVLPAGADAREFQNLVGNVGEFVRDQAGKVSVIGGSAMSPPGRPVDKEFEVPSADHRKGYADVGFRVAFSPPPGPLERLAAILPEGDAGYVSDSAK